MLCASRSLVRVRGVMTHASPAVTRRYGRCGEDVCEINSEVKKGRANSPRVTRFSTRSAETERDGVTYAMDFMWLPGPDSNQRPSG